MRKQEVQNGRVMSTNNRSILNSPEKLNRSLVKLSQNCPLVEYENSKVLTRNQAFHLGLNGSNTNANKVIKCHCYRLMDMTLLQECISKAAICSHCKNSKSKLQLCQDDSAKVGLKKKLLLKCDLCSYIVELDTSKTVSSRYAEVNVCSVQAGLSSGNGLSVM